MTELKEKKGYFVNGQLGYQQFYKNGKKKENGRDGTRMDNYSTNNSTKMEKK